jgi:hypothetical protein
MALSANLMDLPFQNVCWLSCLPLDLNTIFFRFQRISLLSDINTNDLRYIDLHALVLEQSSFPIVCIKMFPWLRWSVGLHWSTMEHKFGKMFKIWVDITSYEKFKQQTEWFTAHPISSASAEWVWGMVGKKCYWTKHWGTCQWLILARPKQSIQRE